MSTRSPRRCRIITWDSASARPPRADSPSLPPRSPGASQREVDGVLSVGPASDILNCCRTERHQESEAEECREFTTEDTENTEGTQRRTRREGMIQRD